MSIAPEIAEFVATIGARAPLPTDEHYAFWRDLFRESNYFAFNGTFMMVKISRLPKPFWGVGKKFIEEFDLLSRHNPSHDTYYVVLLVSPSRGWVFTKSDVHTS